MGLGRGSGAGHRRKPGTRTWVAAGAVLLGSVGTAVVMSQAGSSVSAEGPVKTSVRSLDLSGSGSRRELPKRSTKPFSMVGVTWDNVRSALNGRVEVRTRTAATEQWTG